MTFLVIGTNYKHCSLPLREKLSYTKRRLKDALFLLKEQSFFKGELILSTCNRSEIYAGVDDFILAKEYIINFISKYSEIDRKSILPCLYIYKDEEAVKHLFKVACGLDSLIIGELQILGQVKAAYEEARAAGNLCAALSGIFTRAISCAKIIHEQTKISEGKVSVGSIAVEFIQVKFKDLSNKKILLIGTGKVTELVLKYLQNKQALVTFVSNRTFEKAKVLADQIKARAVRFDDLGEYFKEADVIISATASRRPIIKKDMFSGISKKILIIDLAMPRDVEPGVKELKNIDLYGLEDLDAVIRANKLKKLKEAKKAQVIINREAKKLWKEHIELVQEPVLLP